MSHPSIIRTEFPSAEEVARIYGVPESRVKKILRALTAGKKNVTHRQAVPQTKSASPGKKRSARKK
jgi:hypothetical protein